MQCKDTDLSQKKSNVSVSLFLHFCSSKLWIELAQAEEGCQRSLDHLLMVTQLVSQGRLNGHNQLCL